MLVDDLVYLFDGHNGGSWVILQPSFSRFLGGEEMHLAINKGGVGFVSRTITHASHTGPISANVIDFLSLDKGDTIKLRLFHDGAGARTLYGTTDGINTYLSIAALEILDIV